MVTQADLKRVEAEAARIEGISKGIFANNEQTELGLSLRRVLAAARMWTNHVDMTRRTLGPAVAAEPTTEPEYNRPPFRKVGTVTSEVKLDGEQSADPTARPGISSSTLTMTDLDRLGSVRDELRQAFFDCFFWGITAHGIERHAEEVQTAKSGVFILIQFGTRSKLISPEEGNDWLDVLGEKQTLGDVSEKWMKEAHNGQ